MDAHALDELNIDLDLWTATTSNDRLQAILTALGSPTPNIALSVVAELIGPEPICSILVSYFAGVWQMRKHNVGAACGLNSKRNLIEGNCDGDTESQASEEG